MSAVLSAPPTASVRSVLPYGERFIRSDSTAPEVSQVRLQDGLFSIDLSEPVQEAPLWTALNTSLRLENLTQGVTHNLEMQFQAHEGRQSRRHLVLSPAETIAAGDQLRLTFPVSALEDPFVNTVTVPTLCSTSPGSLQASK